MENQLTCPSCRSAMQTFRSPRKTDGELTIDLCFACQAVWFDEFESLQMAPSGVLDLFRQINDHRDDPRQPWGDALDCPRCERRLSQSFDLCKNGRFTYHRCSQEHGRFTAFSAFLMEKGFVRQMKGEEIAEMAKKVQTIRCSGCGAPVDIRREAVCGHCRSPIVILDPQAVDKALAGLVPATAARHPAAMTSSLAAHERPGGHLSSDHRSDGSLIDSVDLVETGIEILWGLLGD